MSKSLYHISTEFLQLMSSIENNEGEVTEEAANALEINEAELKTKAANYIEFIGDRESFIKRIDEEIKRLQAYKKTQVNLVDRLKGALLNAVELFGDFEVGMHRVGSRKSSSLVIHDETKVPKHYKTTIITEKVDKILLKKDVKDGLEIDGVYIAENKSLSVR